MKFEVGNFIISKNNSRMALIVSVEHPMLFLMWVDTGRQLQFSINSAKHFIHQNKWEYVEI